jgi:serine/threonine-protein kinase
MRLEPGYHVTPHVRLVRLLRKGGMGSVWAAEHLALRTQVAVKFMSAALAEDDEMVTRFTREAAFAAHIKSPHVVHVYDHGLTDDGVPFIVMELLEGEDLSERVKRLGPLSLLEVATILSHLCKALSKAHQAGIVHRDLKLNNVFLVDVDGDIFAKLLDFGIAKQQGKDSTDMTTTGAMVGTLAYMSPEQLHNAKEVDYRTDLWSLAVVAYRALTGELPFREEDGIGALLTAVNAGAFTLPSELRPEIPEALDAWFLKALRRNPAERFPSARAMSEEFDLAVGRESTAIPSSRMSGLPALATPRPIHVGRDAARAGKSAAVPEAGTSAGVVHAQTIVGAEPTRPGKSRGLFRVALAGLALGIGGAASAAVLNRGWLRDHWPLGGVASEPVSPSEADPPARVDAPALAPAVAPPTPPVEIAPVASAATPEGSSSAEVPSAPAADSSAASAAASASSASATSSAGAAPPSPSSKAGSTRGGTRPTGPIRKEKDYGF